VYGARPYIPGKRESYNHHTLLSLLLHNGRARTTDFVVVRLIFERTPDGRQLKLSAKMLGC